jgi:two-component system sensor histidine kinase DctS
LSAGSRRRDVLFAAMPAAVVLLLVSSIGLLLWLTARDARETAQTTLIGDALWVEQTLRFQLATDEDTVARLAYDAGQDAGDTRAFLQRAQLFISNNPEALAVSWIAADGSALASLPHGAALPEAGKLRALALARRSARPVYGDLRHGPDGALLVDLAAPLPGPGETGTVIATLSLATLLARHVPWWIAEKHAVRIVDAAGAVLTEKAHVDPIDPGLVHRIAFDPPIRGTLLEIAPYKPPVARGPGLVTAAIIGLSVLVLASLLALQRHVSRRRRVEEMLRTETAFRRAMEDSLTVGMRARDLDGRILYANPAFCRMVGFEAPELIGRAPPMPYWVPERLAETTARHDALLHGGRKPHTFESRFRRRDGSEFDALLYEAPLVDADGVHCGWMGSIIDITDRKQAAELARRQADSLQRTARLTTLGEMGSTLAHELNQPLAAISSYATGSLNMLRSGEADTSALEDALERMATQARRAGLVIRRIQDLVRKREPRFGPVDMRDVLADVASFAAAEARSLGVRITSENGAAPPPVEADRILLEQVLLNLVRNGMEAMATSPADQRVLDLSLEAIHGTVCVRVADRGCGIAPDLADRLFDPFVSTKAEGMGMGLNICRSIVELHKGRLSHAPREGGGTVFTVALPVRERAAA